MPEELPNIAKILAPLFERVPQNHRPFLLAAAERLAAERYRGWAEQAPDADARAGFLSCADREEEIARRVEATDSESQRIQQQIFADNPDIAELNASVFGGHSLEDQLRIQAAGERVGAASWGAFADAATDSGVQETFRSCIELEIENAEFLEALLARGSS